MRTEIEKCWRKKGAFTLIEMLVVIAVIAILASILLPALGRAKMHARTVICIGNQKQLTLAWILYGEDNDGSVTPNHSYIGPWHPRGPTWVYGYLIHFWENWQDNTNTYHLENSLLAEYLGPAVPLWKCPEDKSVGIFKGKAFPRVRSYSMNINVHSLGEDEFWPFRVFKKMGEIPVPSNMFVIMDEREDTIQDSTFVVDMRNEPPPLGNVPRTAHGGGAVISFADGHVIRKKWQDIHLWPPFSAEAHGPIHATHPRRDMIWLRQHATVRK